LTNLEFALWFDHRGTFKHWGRRRFGLGCRRRFGLRFRFRFRLWLRLWLRLRLWLWLRLRLWLRLWLCNLFNVRCGCDDVLNDRLCVGLRFEHNRWLWAQVGVHFWNLGDCASNLVLDLFEPLKGH
jgi:hypothetical protein